jgi:hypothetical protein
MNVERYNDINYAEMVIYHPEYDIIKVNWLYLRSMAEAWGWVYIGEFN